MLYVTYKYFFNIFYYYCQYFSLTFFVHLMIHICKFIDCFRHSFSHKGPDDAFIIIGLLFPNTQCYVFSRAVTMFG